MGRHFGPSFFVVASASVVSVAAWPMGARAQPSEPIEVEVRGDLASAPPKDPSVAGSVIREERLRAPGLTASDVLRTQPGVAVVDTGGYGALSTASVRGATAAQTPVYLAGVRLNDDIGGTADLSLVPLWFVRQVEVYRSNAPLAGDRLGVGGAIFFEPRLPQQFEASVGAMTGSFGTRALWAQAGAGNHDAAAVFGVRRDLAQNDYTYLNDNGTRFERAHDRVVRLTNADARSFDVWGVGSVRLRGSGRMTLVVSSMERDQGLPGFLLFPSTRARAHFQRRLAGLSSNVACGSGCELHSSASLLASTTRYEDPLNEANFGADTTQFDASRVDTSTSLTFDAGPDVTLTPAISASLEQLKLSASGRSDAHAQRSTARIALQAGWALSRLVSVHALGQAQCDGTDLQGRSATASYGDSEGPTGGSRTCHQFEPSARLGIEVGRPALAFLANVGRYARVPTLTELYGISGAVRGNAALLPESGISLEMGVRAIASRAGALRGGSLDLFGFARSATELIAFQRASTSSVRPHNVGSARVMGLELLAAYAPLPLVLCEVAATFMDPRSTETGGPANSILPYQQRVTVVPRIELKSRLSGALSSLRVSSSYLWTSSRYADPAGLTVIPAQGSWDSEAQLGFWEDRLALRTRVTNVLNETHFDLIGYPLPGRAAYVAMEAQW